MIFFNCFLFFISRSNKPWFYVPSRHFEVVEAFGGTSIDFPFKVIATGGGYIVAGYTTFVPPPQNGVSQNQQDAWIIKLDDSGNLVWQKKLGSSGAESAVDLIATASGEVMVAANTNSQDGSVPSYHGGYDTWILKLSTEGEILSQQSFGGSQDDQPASIIWGGGNKYFIAGSTNSIDGDLAGTYGKTDGWVFSFQSQ